MPIYKYKGYRLDGSRVSGKKDADNPQKLSKALSEDGIIMSEYSKINIIDKNAHKLSSIELCDFSREIGAMLGSGIMINRAIEIMCKRDLSAKIKNIYSELSASLEGGNSLSKSMEGLGNVFPPLIINMFKAGEATGRLSKTADKMALHYEKEHKLNSKILAALTYPIILLFVIILVVIILFTFVLPKFLDLFVDVELPTITKIVMGISRLLTENLFSFLIGVAVFFGIIGVLLSRPKVIYFLHRYQLRLPKFGKLIKIINTARFASTFSALYSGGITVLDSVYSCVETTKNIYIAHQIEDVAERVKNGEMLSSALQCVDGLDTKLASTVEIGEETGKLGEMLLSTADFFEYEAENAIKKMLTFIEPVAIIIMAFIVGTIIISVMLPILTLYNNIG